MSQLRYSNYKRIFGNVETIQFSDTSLAFVSDKEEKPLSTIKPLQSKKPLIEYQKATIGTYGGGRSIRLQHTPILYGHPQRDEEGGKLSTAFTPIEIPQGQPFARKSQLGGTITQHPEKQGFERGVTSAGFPTQEQMTGLGFRQGAASYKPQKYALGEEVIRQEEVPPQQNIEELPQQLAEAPPQSAEGQQMGNIEAAQEQGLSMQPQEIEEPKAKPEEQAADDVAMKVPEGSYVLNYMAVNLAGDDYIIKMLKDARKIAVKQGIDITETESTSKDKVDIRISNGEVIIPPELVAIIGEHQLKLINDKGIAAMKKKEQAEAGQPQEGDYGGQKAYGGFIDMKKGYASGTKVEVEGKKKSPYDPWIRKELHEGEIKYFKDNPKVGAMSTDDNMIIRNPNPPKNINIDAVTKNEFGRVLINTGKFKVPNFKLTDTQQKEFSKYGTNKNIQDTIITRIVSGDPSAKDFTQEQKAIADKLELVIQQQVQ